MSPLPVPKHTDLLEQARAHHHSHLPVILNTQICLQRQEMALNHARNQFSGGCRSTNESTKLVNISILRAQTIPELILPCICPSASPLAESASASKHEANHRASFHSRGINRLIGDSFDGIGGRSHCWRFSHNYLHHTYPNTEGLDADIEIDSLLRLDPWQTHYWFHRFRKLYFLGTLYVDCPEMELL